MGKRMEKIAFFLIRISNQPFIFTVVAVSTTSVIIKTLSENNNSIESSMANKKNSIEFIWYLNVNFWRLLKQKAWIFWRELWVYDGETMIYYIQRCLNVKKAMPTFVFKVNKRLIGKFTSTSKFYARNSVGVFVITAASYSHCLNIGHGQSTEITLNLQSK